MYVVFVMHLVYVHALYDKTWARPGTFYIDIGQSESSFGAYAILPHKIQCSPNSYNLSKKVSNLE